MKTFKPVTLRLLGLVSLWISVLIIGITGCGENDVLDNNSQPVIEPITDQTLDVGDKTTADIYITDADVDDTHIINASSDDTNIATVSVDEDSLTITGNAVGMAMITVSATDDSGPDNDTSIPVTFQVTVNEPLPPPPITAERLCKVGMTLGPGESCGYGPKVVFSVREDGTACRASSWPIYHVVLGINVRIDNPNICGNHDIEQDDFFGTNFSASKNADGSWTINKLPALNIR